MEFQSLFERELWCPKNTRWHHLPWKPPRSSLERDCEYAFRATHMTADWAALVVGPAEVACRFPDCRNGSLHQPLVISLFAQEGDVPRGVFQFTYCGPAKPFPRPR